MSEYYTNSIVMRSRMWKFTTIISAFVLMMLTSTVFVYAQKSQKPQKHTIPQPILLELLTQRNKIPESILNNSDNNRGTDFDKSKYGGVSRRTRRVESDTLKKDRIQIREGSNGDYILVLDLKDPNQRIRISIWNMLGKKVLDDYNGPFKNLEEYHIIKNTGYLSKGVYLCIVQGDNVRLDAKFIVSR